MIKCKLKCKRTKRRKIKNELDIIQYIYFNNDDTFDSSETDNEIVNSNNSSKSNKISLQSNCEIPSTFVKSSNNISSTRSSTSLLNSNKSDTPLLSHGRFLNSNILAPIENSSLQVQNYQSPKNYTLDFLSQWAVKYNVPQNAVSALLRGLKARKCFSDFPIDCRTLLGTPKQNSYSIKAIKPGSYFHFGLGVGILRYAPPNLNIIKIAIGIDGLPISKSSGAQFWPIMAYIITDIPFYKKVFPVGIYYGYEKPMDSNEYLSDFVTEAIDLINNGIHLNNHNLKISIDMICCDTPAKSFILKVKGHSGFSSCTRCHIEGEYINNRVCFPYASTKSIERTHETYLLGLDEDYHASVVSISNLVELPNFDIVKAFPLDYMHLICLGVMKKMLVLWFSKGPLTVRVRAKKVVELSEMLLSLNSSLSTDFVRKIRSIQDMARWKATEFRLFLLYLGPIVLKSILNERCYSHFMALNISMIILLSPDYGFLIKYARQLLNFFVQEFQSIYGNHYLSHNIHGLLHLCDDYERFGPLDNCSCFIFENYMKELKSLIRKHEMPLQQVVNRYFEKYSSNINDNDISNNQKRFTQTPILQKTHENGPVIEHFTGPQCYNLFFLNMKIKIKKENDSYILTKDKKLVKCLNIMCHNDNEIMILGKYFKSVKPFFSEPIDSNILNIYVVQHLSNSIKFWKLSEVVKKMIVFKNGDQIVAMPILNSSL